MITHAGTASLPCLSILQSRPDFRAEFQDRAGLFALASESFPSPPTALSTFAGPCLSFPLCPCLQMEDDGVIALAEAYRASLSRLDLSSNKKIAEQGLRSLGQHCGQLRSLNLTGCTIGDTALMKVAGCTNLEVCHCERIEAVPRHVAHNLQWQCLLPHFSWIGAVCP